MIRYHDCENVVVRWCNKKVLSCRTQSHFLQKQHTTEKIYKTSHCYTLLDRIKSTMASIASSASSPESNTETSTDDSSTNNSNKSGRVLPINIACDKGRHPMQRHILALTNQIPPIHFLFLPQCYIHSETRTQMLKKIYKHFLTTLTVSMMENCPFT